MKDKSQSPLEALGDEALEARVVAWVLGEASAFEAAEMEERCASDPELKRFADRMRSVNKLIEGQQNPEHEGEWKLSGAKRQKVIDLLGVEAPAPEPQRHELKRRLVLALAAVILASLIALPVFFEHPGVLKEAPAIVGYTVEGSREPRSELGDLTVTLDERRSLRRGSARARLDEPRSGSGAWFYADGKHEGPGDTATRRVDVPASDRFAARDTAGAIGDAIDSPNLIPEVSAKPVMPPPSRPVILESESMSESVIGANEVRSHPALTHGHGDEVATVRRELYLAEGAYNLGRYDTAKDQFEKVLETDPYNKVARQGLERVEAATSDYYRAAYDQSRAELLTQVDDSCELAVPSEVGTAGSKRSELLKEAPADKVSLERYRFVLPAEQQESDLSKEGVLLGREFVESPDDEVNRRLAGLPALEGVGGDSANVNLLEPPASDELAGGSIVGSGNRSGDGAIVRHSIDSILNRPDVTLSAQGDVEAVKAWNVQLEDAVRKQAQLVEERRKSVTDLMRTQGLVYGTSKGQVGQGGFSEEDAAEVAAQSYLELAEEKVTLESQLESLTSYDDDQLMRYAAGLDLPENRVRELHPQYLEAKRAVESLKVQGLGVDHPELKKKTELAANLEERLSDGVADVHKTIEAQRELAQAQLDRLEQARNDYERAVLDLASLRSELAKAEAGLAGVDGPMTGEAPRAVDIEARLDAMEELSAEKEPYSTFSLHVSDASFKLAAAAIKRGEVPVLESIRPEEFYNAFDYGDPSPAADEPVACVVEQSAHPVFPQRNLLRIAVRTGAAGRASSTPLNLTLLLDNSGSMERVDRAEGLGRAVEGLSSLLKEGDTVTVAGFSRQPRLLADQIDGKDAVTLNGLVDQIPAEGGTNLEEALKLGGELARRQFAPEAQNRVVLFTDGAANLGDADPESLHRKIEELRNGGIAFDAAGFGADGLNDRLLERLTRNGNGRYYVVDGPEDADEGFARRLAGAFRPAAENVKVQVVFNPARVGRYKLIGFEDHRLKKEDFQNDAVDAAELASEESGVAVYQFEALPEGEGEVGEVRVRFRDLASGEMIERRWPIAYDPQAPSFDQAPPSLQLAGMAALTAEKLRGAPMADAVGLDSFRGVLAQVKTSYDNHERIAQLEKMLEACE